MPKADQVITTLLLTGIVLFIAGVEKLPPDLHRRNGLPERLALQADGCASAIVAREHGRRQARRDRGGRGRQQRQRQHILQVRDNEVRKVPACPRMALTGSDDSVPDEREIKHLVWLQVVASGCQSGRQVSC